MIVSIPLAEAEYPVVLVGSPLKPASMTSVVAVPVAEVVTTVAHVADEIALVPNAEVPEAIVVEKPPLAPGAEARAVRTPAPVVVVEGAAPAPPPIIRALAASAAEEDSALVLLKYGTPPLVPDGVQVSVPLVVTGEPDTEQAALLGADSATLVTVPEEAPIAVQAET